MNGIKTKLHSLKQNIAIHNHDIIIIIETWLTPDISSNEILPAPDTYHVYRTDRESTLNSRSRGGIVLIAINKKYDTEEILFPKKYLIEASAISISCESVPIFDVLAIYSPSYNKQQQTNELMNILQKIKAPPGKNNIMIIGDLNTTTIQWDYDIADLAPTDELMPSMSETGTDLVFINRIIEKGFTQKNQEPNNQGVFLDLIFVNFEIQCIIKKAEANLLLDKNSYHHVAYILSINTEQNQGKKTMTTQENSSNINLQITNTLKKN